ncbi:hypothetical protein N7468_005901 [Penicillium chermesinum]|uniref:Uncharacterized protein n=1 Tax=Penicillium chermesinum TaxID=63820 RepID=A0A9W9TNE9_9EURO|nr:uncharacterized protein N7468_005901 [Penicillium chermesinum]KAJ5232945.1 hypothetical protein N7468_005901 [Penicillium chermesinum]
MSAEFEVKRKQRLAMELRATEVQKSQEFFERSKHRGRGVAFNMGLLHIQDDSSPSSDIAMED